MTRGLAVAAALLLGLAACGKKSSDLASAANTPANAIGAVDAFTALVASIADTTSETDDPVSITDIPVVLVDNVDPNPNQ